MKLRITLTLAALTSSACSAFALSPNHAVRSAIATNSASQKPAFLHQNVVDKSSRDVSLRAAAATSSGTSLATRGGDGGLPIDIPLLSFFALWYLGNYYYNITNKLALKAAGGASGFPMTISALQLGIGSLYGIFLWLAPDAREKPSITMDDIIKMLPVAFCYAGAHSASVFSFSAGSVSFGQIVKAAEPAFAAVLSQFVYNRPVSKAKWLCLPIVIGGVILASVNELDFAWSALISACIANMFAAVRGNENKKLMETEGLKDRLGSVGNQFCVTSILGFLLSIPFVLWKEGGRLGQFIDLFKTTPALRSNLIASALWFYGYNEVSTMTLKKTNAVTQSVANTAKRVIVIVGVAVVLGESLDFMKLLGCSIGIGGVFLYSIIDNIVKAKE
jgi:solute carrier family 35 protein E1